MDRANLGHEVPASSSAAFPPPSIYSFSSSTNQAAATGISRARLPKQKKHSATSRARPIATIQDGGAVPGFKTSRSEIAKGDPDDAAENSETTSVREQLYGWKPFVPDTSTYLRSSSDFVSGIGTSGLNVSSCSTGPGSGPGLGTGGIQGHALSFGSSLSGNTSPGLFVFGCGMDKDISSLRDTLSQNSSAQNLGSAESVKSEDAEHMFGTGAFLDSSRSVETGIMSGQSNCFVGVNNKLSGLDAFLCEANAKQQGNLPQKSSMASNTGPFNELKSQMPIFGNRKEMKCPYSNENSFNSDEDLLAKQHDRTMKMHHEDTSNGNIKKKEKNHSYENIVKAKFSSDESSLSMLHEDVRKLKIEKSVTKEYGNKDSNVFEFVSGIKKDTFIGNSSSHVDVSYCKLPEEMYKLHLENSADEIHGNTHSDVFVFGRGLKEDAPLRPTTAMGLDDADISKLPKSIQKLNIHSLSNEEYRNDNQGAFVFNSGVNGRDSSAKSASLHSNDSYVCKLPNEMGKMKLNGCGSESESLKTTMGDSWHKHAFAGITRTTTLVDSSVEEIGEKVKELKVDSGEAFPDICNGSTSVKSGDFALRSTANVSFLSAETSNMPSTVLHKTSSKHEDEALQFSFDVNAHNEFFEKMRAPNVGRKGEDIAGDTYGSACGSSSYPSENAVQVAHCGIKRGDLTGVMGHTCPPDRSSLNACGSSNCDLQSGDDGVSNATPLQAHESCELGAETSSFPSLIPTFQSSGIDFNSANMHTALETPGMEFKSQKHGMSMFTKENLFTKSHMNVTFGTNTGDSKGVRLKKKRAKSRRSTPVQLGTPKQFVSVDMVPEETLEEDTINGYSPMDYSPYQETLASKQDGTIEASGASIESIPFDLRHRFTDTQSSTSIDGKDETVSEAENFDTCYLGKHTGADSYGSRVPSTSQLSSDSSLIDEFASGLRKVSLTAQDEYVSPGITRRTSVNSGSFSFGPKNKQTTGEDGSGITFAAADQFNFQFAASSSNQGSLSATCTRRKSKVKVGKDSRSNCAMVPTASPLSNLFVFSKAHVATGSEQEQKRSDEKREGKINNEAKPNEGPTTTAACFAAREACEKWRLRGNEAYTVGNLSKAEEYYNQGINSISLQNISNICSRALMLCYSNRAATRMSLSRLREAIGDCKMALAIDPCFLRARLRAANIHLSLGEPGDAMQHFQKCLELNCEADSDKKLLLEAANGVEKAQRLNDLIDQSSAFLMKRTHRDGAKILEIVSEALSICPHSESMLELKAEALLLLRNYDEAIQICEQTIELAVKNAVVAEADCQIKDHDYSGFMESSYVRLWRWHIISKSYFYLGKLHEADELLQKCEKVKPVTEKFSETLISFAVNLRELLRLKTAGNEAFQAGRHLEAVDFYSSALALNTESRPFTAICLCNRAAAYQALGQITDAIADCSLAIALDSTYRKAISRRATLHEMIRDYGQAAADLRMLISFLEKSDDYCNASATLQRSTSNASDLHQAHCRLSTCEEEVRKGVTLDMYMILGIERSSSVAEVKKAYRKAALRHHPDKAGQLLARSDSNDDRVWKEIAKEVYADTDRLFKMIVEAYTILGDSSKRLLYDAEEDLRNTKKGYTESSSNRTTTSSYHSQNKQNVVQRHWRSYGSSHRQWSESTRPGK